MTRQDLQADLEYVRTLAEEGRAAPLLGGRFMVFWGALAGATLITHWAIVTDRLDLPLSWLLWLWMGMGIVGGVVSWPLGRSIQSAPGASAANNRVSTAVWSAMTAGLFAGFIGIFTAVNVFSGPYLLWNTLPGLTLLLYGTAYLGTAFFHGSGLQIFCGVVALIAGAVTLALVQSADAYLAAAAGVIVSTLIPGIIYWVREPKTTV